MPGSGASFGARDGERPMAGTYTAVLIVEAVVLLGLWAFSRYFGSA